MSASRSLTQAVHLLATALALMDEDEEDHEEEEHHEHPYHLHRPNLPSIYWISADNEKPSMHVSKPFIRASCPFITWSVARM